MSWSVLFHDAFAHEFARLDAAVQDELRLRVRLLAHFGPQLGRPHADTLKGSRHPNMKELRFEADGGVWRIAFAFDPRRSAIILIAGDKAGVGERRFYRQLISAADDRFDQHLSDLSQGKA